MAKAAAIFNMATQIDIVNLALSALGSGATIKSINPPDGTAEAKQAAKWLPIALQRLIEEHDWSFLTTTEEPAQYEGDYTETNGYKYAFAVPADFVRMIAVYRKGDIGKNQDFQVGTIAGDEALAIYTDVEFPVVKYVKYSDSAVTFPGYFVEPLVLLLASYLVGPIKRSDTNSQAVQGFLNQYRMALQRARQIDVGTNIQKSRPKLIPSHLRARKV